MKPRVYTKQVKDKIHYRCEAAQGIPWALDGQTGTLTTAEYRLLYEEASRYIDFIDETVVRR
jgi:hypothetical protein